MRMQHRSTLIWGVLVASFCVATVAGPARAADDLPLLDDGAGYYAEPAMFGEEYGIAPYGDGGYYPPQQMMVPPDMQPWPDTSPFDHQFDQHRNLDGLWFNEFNSRGRRWHGGVEALWMWFQPPHATTKIGLPFPANAQPPATQVKDLGVIEELETAGVRPFIGYINPDDSGFEFNMFYLLEANESNSDPDAGTFDRPGEIRLRGLDDMYSRSLRFNQTLHVDYDVQAYGAEAYWMTTPFMGREKSMLRLLVGGRYFGIDESMSIIGRDSINGTTVIDSTVQTQLGGPQAGVRWDLGGQSLKIITTAKFGALGAWVQRDLDARNYGGVDTFQRHRHSQIIPMIEVGVNVQMPLFQHVPILKKTPGFRNSIFRAGYSFTGLYLMQRPGLQIDYRDPIPLMDYNPTRLDISGANFALEWNW